MFLAEALMSRADLRSRVEQVRAQLRVSARWQEGEEPEESATVLLAHLRGLEDELTALVRSIARTNGQAELEPGMTIAEALVVRDGLAARRRSLVAAADAASGPSQEWESVWDEDEGRSRRVRVSFVQGLDVKALRVEADRVAAEFRALDVSLQGANWRVQLV